jgi:tetratricopeptide (TPR) repeat protein
MASGRSPAESRGIPAPPFFTIIGVFYSHYGRRLLQDERARYRILLDTNSPGRCLLYEIGYFRSFVKLALYISLLALAVSLLFRQVEWPWVAFRQGETAFQSGHYLEAAALYERSAQKLNDPRVLERLAKCWLAADRPDKAETALIRLVEQLPKRLAAIKALASIYQKAQQPGKAIPLFTNYLAIEGKLDPAGELQLARIYRQAFLYDDAVPYYLKAAEDPKQNTAAKVELRSWQGRYDEAAQNFRQVLAAEPANRQARLSLARVLSWAGHYKESEDEYRRLLAKP